MATILEHLPDEILLIICNYLSQYEIITALFGLNNRLNCTISQFLQSLVLSTENNFNLSRSRQLLSMIGLYIQSLTIRHIHLSSADISLASNIQELTFMHTQPDHIPTLSNLTDLNVITGPSFQSIDFLFSNNDTLHSVYIASTSPFTIPSFSPPKYSTIKQLAITLRSFDDFIRLVRICPTLTCINLVLQYCKPSNQLSTDIPSTLRIFSLRTTFNVNISFDELKNLFQYLPSQLEQLAIEILTDDVACVDGELWENYLKETFSDLNRFEFFILLRKEYPSGTQPLRLPAALKTFQSAYWSLITPQKIIGYYTLGHPKDSICIHTEVIPTVRRRRYFLN